MKLSAWRCRPSVFHICESCLWTFGRIFGTTHRPVARPPPTQDNTHTHTHTQKTPFIHQSVPCTVFEPTLSVFERWKAAYAECPVATLIGTLMRCTSHLRRGRKIKKKRLLTLQCLSVRPHGTALLLLDGIL
jgi:hypothetical protein